jgi:tetratricopeptide (TPR) repeat protein
MAVRASFEVSFASLPSGTQADGVTPADAFRLLGLWQGPSISSAAAAALFGTPEYSAEDALETLVDAHLLESATSDRYKFHDLLRVYSAERAVADLSGPARDAALGRLLRWYMRTADAAGTAVSPHRYNIPLEPVGDDPPPPSFTGVDDALAWYDGERANLVAATRQASSVGLHDVAWRLPAPLFQILWARGNWADLVTTHRLALDSARHVGNRRGEAWVLVNLGEGLGITGDSEGIGCLEQALAISREAGDPRGESRAANNLADAYTRLGRTEEAIDLLQRGLDLSRAAGHRFGEGVALVNLGDALLDLDRAEEALEYLQQARRTFAEVEAVDGAGYALWCLGRCYLSLGRDADAVDHLGQALTSHQISGNRQRQAATLRLLGRAQAHSGLAAEARESWTRAAKIFDDLGDSAQAAEVRAEQDASGFS